MKREQIIGEFLDKNPEITVDELDFGADGCLEWFCEHGSGHTVFSPDNLFAHQCCGCCRKIIPLDNLSRKNHVHKLKKKIVLEPISSKIYKCKFPVNITMKTKTNDSQKINKIERRSI